MSSLKERFLEQLQIIAKFKMMTTLTPFIQGEDALLLRLYLYKVQTPKALADALDVTKGRITAILNSLLKKDYINKSIDPSDRRFYHVQLSEYGYQYIDEKLKGLDDYFDQMFKYVGDKDAEALVDALDRLIPKIEKLEAK